MIKAKYFQIRDGKLTDRSGWLDKNESETDKLLREKNVRFALLECEDDRDIAHALRDHIEH